MNHDDYTNALINNDQEEIERMEIKILEEIKKENKGYYSWKKRIPGCKPLKIETYSSGDRGTIIKNAITGECYKNCFVGSKNEDLFFTVKMSTGEFNGRLGPKLFYSTPEEYENHMKVIVSDETKQKWFEKYNLRNKNSTKN